MIVERTGSVQTRDREYGLRKKTINALLCHGQPHFSQELVRIHG